MAERPLYTLYKNLKAQNYDVPNDYNKFESALTRDGKSGSDNRHAIYENLKAQNFDVPDTYERFYTALFEPRSKTSSRAKGGSVPMSAADRARFLSGAAAISASAKQITNNAGRYNRLKQRKQKQQKDFGRVNLGTHLTPFGGDANNVVKDEFAYNPETGKAGSYVTSDNENAYTQSDAEQKQAILDKYGEEWNKAVDMGMVPSELDKAEPGLSDTDVAMRQMERRQEWLDENQNRRSQELNESMHLQDSPFVASGGAVAPSSFNSAISNEANRLSDAEYGAYNTAKAYNQMLRTTLLQELKEQKQRNENAGWWKDKWNDISNYFGAMFNTMLDPKLYSQGVMDAAVASNLLQVKKGMEDGTIKKGSNAGNAAQVMLSSIQQQQGEAAKQQQYGTKAYQYGDVSGRSLKFMADFALSGWRNVMTTGFSKAGEKVGEKMALGALGKWFTKNTGRVLGDMAGSAALAATNQLGSTYNNVIERYVGMNNENGGVTQDKDGDLKFNEGVRLGKAIKDGLGSATIENFSEMFGEYLPGASKILSKLGLSKTSSFFEKIGNNAYYKWLSNATNKSGIQGVMSEIAEEEFGTALHAAWGDGDGSWSDFNIFTNPDAREKQIDTCLGMFYSVGFMQSPRTAVGAINAVKYFNIKHQVTKADKFGQMMFGENWDEIKNKIDVTTNADLTKTVLDATRSDSMTAKQKGAVINYAMFLSKLRGFNQASDAKTKDKVEEGETGQTLSNDLDDAYTEGHNADDADRHDIQIQHEDQAKTLAAALNISEQQLSGMSDEELESLTGQDDKLDQAIYDYQLSTARYQGVVDDAQDKVDLAANQAEQRVNMYTDQSRGSVRNATIKASGGAEDYGVYIISGNIATHEDGSIDVSNSDDMILYFDPTTNSVEHADALMFAELGEELPADEVKAQAVADAKENAIKEVAGIIDGTVDVGSQFSVTDADGTEHTYEVLADNGDGTAMITIDGNVPTELVKGENVQIPYSFEDLQQMKDLEDQKRLEAAKTEREQMEKERNGQQTQETEDSQPSFDFNQILNDNGNVVLVDVLGKDGNTKYPGSKLFLIRDAGAKAKVVEMKSDGAIVPHAVNKEDVATISTMTLDEYKQAMPSSMIEENSGEIDGDRGGIEVNDELPPVPDNVTINGDGTYSVDGAVQGGENTTASSEQTPAITLEDGTIVPMLEDGNPDFSKLTAEQTAELYDTQFDEDAEGIVSGYVSDAKKALDKANNMTVKGKTFVEQKASKDAKEKAIADAQASYDSAIAIRDAYNERQLAKEENTPEGRKSLIEKARRKFARLKNSEEWSERTGDLWNETVGKLLHRLYDDTGIDVFNDTPNTVYEYVAANVGPYSLNYEGNDNSKGVQQETGLSRSDFAKLGWLAAEGKGMTIDEKVHRLWENRPSNLESADTQDIRNALISLITSGQTAFQARDYILNQRIELAESALEEQLRQEEDAAEAQNAKEEEEKKKAELEKKKAEEEKTNENRNAPELSHEQQKAKEDGEKLGFPAFDNEGEPINQNVIELANWAKEQGLEIDPTSKLNSYADLYLMCKDGFGVSTLVPDVGEDVNQVFYFPDNVQGEQLLKLQEEFNVGRDLKHSADMNSEITEGAMFYDGDTAREFKEFVDKKVEEQNKVFGEQRTEEDLPFSAKENGTQQTPSERDADVEKNKVDDMKVVDNIVGQKTRKAFERLAKMMGANVQWQYSDKLGNGWIQETTDADGNLHRTIFITLDSSITEGAQFIFGHEMTHQIKNLNPAAYNELTQLVLDTYGSDAFDKAVDETMKRYSDAGFSGRDRDYYAEEVVADAVGEMIRDLNLAHTLAMKMSHPLLAAIHEVLQKIKLAFYGTEYSDVTKNIISSIEQAYVKTAKGRVTNSETGEDVSFSLRLKSAIKETETNPSDAQKESGNYKKGHIKFGGYDYTIENPKGSTRSGKDANGKEWKVTMHDTYGYIRGKFGKDGDHMDMFINDKADLDNWDGDVFVVDQVNPDGSFDEHKVMYGYDSMDDAEKAYLANYSKGWKGLGNITGASKADFDKWLDTSNRKLKPFADYAKVKFSQAKSVSDPRYSLKDEKTLAGVHNITEEKLRKALKLGGLANPSLAVIDTSKSAHDNFGEISFIAPSGLVDKRTGKTAGTWITDAYTQRYPSVERQMSEKGSQKFMDWVDSLEYSAADKAEIKRQTEDALSNNNAPAWELMYLKEKGIDIKEYNSKVDYRWKEIIRDHPTAEDILSSMQNDSELNEKVTSLVKHTIIHPTWEKVSLEVRRKIYEETGNKVSPINPQVRKQTKEIFERDYKSNLLNKDGSPRKKDVKKVVEDIVKEHNDTKKYDFYLSKVKASDYVNKNGLYDDYTRWQEKKLDEFGTKNRIFRGYKPDGTRKYVPETLDNVSKAMREEAGGQTNGSEYTSFGSFIAKIASRVDSTDEMRANKDKLSSNEDKKEFYEKWSGVYYDLAKFLYNDVLYGEQRLHDIVLQSDPKKYAKKEYGITLTPTFMKKLDALKNAVRTELKSGYFETKYNRPIRLNEFAAAVVPYNLGEDVRKGIEDAGLPMYNYDPNKEGDRSRAFNEAINSSDNIRFSLRYDRFEHDLNQWKKDNNLPKDAKRPTIPQRNAGESAVDFLKRVDEYRKQMALWKTAPTYEQHLLSDDTALGEFNRELQRGSVLKRIAFQDSMLAIRKAQEAIMKEVGVDRLNMAEDAYTAENRSHGKGKNEFEEYNNEFLQPLRKAYHQMKKVLGDSYDNVRLYMMAKHGLERNAQMAFKKSLEADYEDVAQRIAAYKAYKGDIKRMGNDSGFELGLIDYATWVRTDNAIKMKYSPSYMKYRYDKMGITFDYSGLSALFDGSDFEEAAHKLVRDIESKHIVETKKLWDATNAATKKILRDGYKAGMMSKDTYQYVRDMYSHYIPLRGWDGTTADQVWDYVGGGKGAFNQTLKTAHGRTSIADDPIAYIENMAESGILLNNKNWVKQHLMLLAQNHPTSLLTLSKAWYVKSTDANGNEEWIPATPQITSQMNSNQVKAAIDAFEQKMEQMAQTGDATQKRDGLNIAYPQTHSEEREHEVRVMKDGEEYVIYVNGDPQLAQAMNNTRAHRVREIQSGKLDRAAAWLGRKMAAAYTSLSPLFIPSNYFRDLTMTLASTAIREDAKYNYLLRKNLVTSWNLGFMLRDFQNGKLRDKVNNGNATQKEQMFYDFMMNGGETGFVSSLDVEDLKKKFKNDLKDLNRWKANPVKVGHIIMDSIEFMNRAIEDSNRFAIYMTSIQYGRSIDEAVNDAKNVTLNFNRKGTGEYGWQMIRNLYLFINPAVQSLQTLGALGKHHPYKFTAVTASWIASGVLVPIVNAALMQMAAAFLGGDGDDDKDWYKDISKKYWQFSKWDRRNNFIMWVPTTNEFVKIPLAQEFRAFYGLGDMIASKMMGGELAEESWSQYAEDLLGQVVDMLPLDPTGYDGNIAVSLMPNAIRPVFELSFNVDFTGKPLFKDTEYNKYDPNFTKAYVGTPDWLVRASRMMNSIGNDYPDVQQNKWDAFGNPRFSINNPAVVDHVLSSYLGGAYTMGSQVIGLLTKSLNDPKEIKVADIPLFSKFVSNPDDRPVTKKQGDEFWNMKENHDRAANTLSKLKKQAKVDGDYSMLERFYGSEEYKQYKKDDVKVKKYEEDKKKERAEESGEEYRPHKLNAEDIYKDHATPKDDFEDLKLKQLYTKLNGFKSTYDLLVDTAPSQREGYYNANKAAIDAIDEVTLDKQEISELKKGFLDDGKDAYNAEDMKQIRELRKKVLSVLEKANKVVVANQKANAKKK